MDQGAGAGQGQGQGAQPNPVQVSRRVRAVVYVLSMLLVLYLLSTPVEEQPPPAPPAPQFSTGNTPPTELESLLQRTQVEFADRNFPSNVTGIIFVGGWKHVEKLWRLPPRGNVSIVAAMTRDPPPATNEFTESEGAFVMKFLSMEQPLPGLHFLRGLLRVVDGTAKTDHDIYSAVRGVYLPESGQLIAVSTSLDPMFAPLVTSGEGGKPRRLSQLLPEQAWAGVEQEGVSHEEMLRQLDDEWMTFQEQALARSMVTSGKSDLSSLQLSPSSYPYSSSSSSSPASRSVETAITATQLSPQDMLDSGLREVAHRRLASAAGASSQTSSPSSASQGCAVVLRLDFDDVAQLRADSENNVIVTKDEPGDDYSGPRLLAAQGSIDTVNCTFSMNVTVRGLLVDREALETKTSQFATITTLCTLAQIFGVVYQLMRGTSPSSATRMSLLTVGAQAVMDSYACLLFLLAGVVHAPWFNAFATAAFTKLILFSILEMRLLLVLWNARRPSAFADGWASLRRELTLMYARFYCTIVIGGIIIYQLLDYLTFITFVAFSFWVPQIVHNAQHGTKLGLTWSYVAIMSLTRLVIPAYLWGCPANFLVATQPYQTDPMRAFWLLAWVAAQVTLMAAQARWGPQFFVPGFLLPHKYDYRRPVSEAVLNGDHSASGSGAGAGAGAGPAPAPPTRLQALRQSFSDFRGRVQEWWQLRRSGYRRVVTDDHRDTDSVDIEMGLQRPRVNRWEAGGAATAAASEDESDEEGVECVICTCKVDPGHRDYMLTPCDHLFHDECLTRWMDVKMECPVCRAPLPPA